MRRVLASWAWVVFAAAGTAACSGGDSGGSAADAKVPDARRLFADAGEPNPPPAPDARPASPDAARPDPADAGPGDPDATPNPSGEEAEAPGEQTNDDFASAEAITLGAPISGSIGAPIDESYDLDLFLLEAAAGDTLRVTLEPAAGSELVPSVTVMDEPGDFIRWVEGEAGAAVTRELYVLAAGPLAVMVSDARNQLDPPEVVGGETFGYSVRIERTAPVAMVPALPLIRRPGELDALGSLSLFEVQAVAGARLTAEVFASRLEPASDLDTVLVLEDRTGGAPVVLDLNDDLDVDQGVTDSRVEAVVARAGAHRVILDHYGVYGPARGFELSIESSATPPAGGLVINEVDYDNPGGDTAELVELFNGGPSAVSLDGLALVFVNGANGAEYRRVELGAAGAMLPSGEYLVVAMDGVAVPGGVAVVRDARSAQNGPDGVALVDTASGVILDALAYEGPLDAAMIDGVAGAHDLVHGTGSTSEDSETADGSLSRCPNGQVSGDDDTDWTFSAVPTPGAANDCP